MAANGNGKSALQYLLEEVDGTVKAMEEEKPDFGNCPVGKDFAEQQFRGTLLMLKMQRIYVRESLKKSSHRDGSHDSNGDSDSDNGSSAEKGKWGFLKIGPNYIQASGVATVALVLVYLILKVHNVPVLP